MIALLAMVVLGAACWVLRASFIAFVPAERLPAAVRNALSHLAPAVLAALVASEIVGSLDGLDALRAAVLLTAVVLAGVAARRTGSTGIAIAIGLSTAVLLDVVLV